VNVPHALFTESKRVHTDLQAIMASLPPEVLNPTASSSSTSSTDGERTQRSSWVGDHFLNSSSSRLNSSRRRSSVKSSSLVSGLGFGVRTLMGSGSGGGGGGTSILGMSHHAMATIEPLPPPSGLDHHPTLGPILQQAVGVLGLVQKELLMIMEKDTMSRFKATKYFVEYLEKEPSQFILLCFSRCKWGQGTKMSGGRRSSIRGGGKMDLLLGGGRRRRSSATGAGGVGGNNKVHPEN